MQNRLILSMVRKSEIYVTLGMCSVCTIRKSDEKIRDISNENGHQMPTKCQDLSLQHPTSYIWRGRGPNYTYVG